MLNSSREGAFLNSRLGVKIKLLEYAGNGKETERKLKLKELSELLRSMV